MFGVPCTCTAVPHPVVIEYCSKGAKCTNGNVMQLEEKHLYWSKKVIKKLNCFFFTLNGYRLLN